MQFRWHRGALSSSMETIVYFDTLNELKDILNSNPLLPFYKISELEIKSYGYDARIGWDTHIVIVKGCAIGFTDGPVGDCEHG